MRSNDAKPAGDYGGADPHVVFLGNIVKMNPAAVGARYDPLGPQNYTVGLTVSQGGQRLLDFLRRKFMSGFHPPACKDFICMVMVVVMFMVVMMMVMVMIVAATGALLAMLVMIVVMLVTIALVVIMIVVMMMVLMLVIIVVIVMMMLVIMVMAAAIIIVVMMVMMMLMLLFFMKLHSLFHQLLCQ